MKYALPVAILVFTGVEMFIVGAKPQLDSLGVQPEYPAMIALGASIIGGALAAAAAYFGIKTIEVEREAAAKLAAKK